jgi:hypothetical protein
MAPSQHQCIYSCWECFQLMRCSFAQFNIMVEICSLRNLSRQVTISSIVLWRSHGGSLTAWIIGWRSLILNWIRLSMMSRSSQQTGQLCLDTFLPIWPINVPWRKKPEKHSGWKQILNVHIFIQEVQLGRSILPLNCRWLRIRFDCSFQKPIYMGNPI